MRSRITVNWGSSFLLAKEISTWLKQSFHFFSPGIFIMSGALNTGPGGSWVIRWQHPERNLPMRLWGRMQCRLGSYAPRGRIRFSFCKGLSFQSTWIWFKLATFGFCGLQGTLSDSLCCPRCKRLFSCSHWLCLASSWQGIPGMLFRNLDCAAPPRAQWWVCVNSLAPVALPKNRPQVVGICGFGVVKLGRGTAFAE